MPAPRLVCLRTICPTIVDSIPSGTTDSAFHQEFLGNFQRDGIVRTQASAPSRSPGSRMLRARLIKEWQSFSFACRRRSLQTICQKHDMAGVRQPRRQSFKGLAGTRSPNGFRVPIPSSTGGLSTSQQVGRKWNLAVVDAYSGLRGFPSDRCRPTHAALRGQS